VIRTLRETSVGSHPGVEPLTKPAPAEEPTSEPVPQTMVQLEPEPLPAPAEAPAPPPSFEDEEPDPVMELDAEPAERLESAILAEGRDAEAAEAQARETESLLGQPWHHAGEAVAGEGARLSQSLSIVSVGEATRVDDRAVRVPLVLGDGDGETSTLVLTLRLDPLVDEASD
jgi:hypothetical protein